MALAAGCSAPWYWGGPDLVGRADELKRRARPASELGLAWADAESRTLLRPLCFRTDDRPAVLDFHGPALADARPVVRVRVNGRSTYALLDSGAEASLVEWPGALRLGITPLRSPKGEGLIPLPGQGLGLPFRQYLGIAAEVRAGAGGVRNVPVGILDAADALASGGRMSGARVELLLGADFLRAFRRIEFDFVRERVRLDPPRDAPPAGERLAVVPLESAGIPVVEMELDGHGRIPVGLDTGGEFGLWIPGRLATQWRLPRPERRNPVYGSGIGGSAPLSATVPQTLRVGKLTLAGLPAVIGPQGAGRADPPHALLGRMGLRNLLFYMDLEKGQIGFFRP